MEQGYKWMVCTECMTYNQAPFIEETMNGFTMQETTFPVVTLIVDDASTDGESKIIRQYLKIHFQEPYRIEETEYAHVICARHKTNPNCEFVVLLLKYNHYSIKKPKKPYIVEWTDNAKYYAMCEGDDYWICQNKLQSQVDYMEKNDDCVLTYTNALFIDEHSKPIIVKNPKRYNGDCLKSLLEKGNYIVTAGVCYRKEADEGWKETMKQIPFTLLMGDKPLWIFLSTKGMFHYETKKMICYRKLQESASHYSDIKQRMKFLDNGEQLTIYFNKLYNGGLKEVSIRRAYSSARIRASFRYSWEEIYEVIKVEIKKNPSSLFNMKAITLLLLRIFGLKR